MALTKDFGLGPDEIMVRDGARKFLRDTMPIDRLRKLVAADHHQAYESEVQPVAWDADLWSQIVDLGWTGLAVPEAAGGVGMNAIAVALLAEELGRAAFPSPLPATLAATAVLRAAAADTWLAAIASGTPTTLAVTNEEGSWRSDTTSVTATADGSGYRLTGTSAFVQDARKCRLLIVSAKAPGGIGLWAVPVDAKGVTIRPDRIVDLTRDQATVVFDGVAVDAAAQIAAPGTGPAALDAAMPTILTILAADLCGAGEWQLQTTTEYAKVRKQFDRPIGFFQAVKHPIVNVMIGLDRAKSLTYAAACAIDHEPEDALRLARMAKAAAADAAAFASDRSVQLHGGIGFTWECDVHIYFKRQQHGRFLWGDGTYQRARVAELL